MVRLSSMVVVFVLALALFTSPAASFPPVPEYVVPVRVINNFGKDANFYVWMDAQKVYVHVAPITTPFNLVFYSFLIIQDGVQYNMSLVDAGASAIGGNIFVPVTGILSPGPFSTSAPVMNKHMTVIYQYPPTFFDVYPPGQQPPPPAPDPTPDPSPSAPIPTPGIWKSGDGALSMYLQLYQAGSCVIVVTMGDGIYTSFLDPSYADGINVANDVDSQGYSLNLNLENETSGLLSVTLPFFGQVTTPVQLQFPALS